MHPIGKLFALAGAAVVATGALAGLESEAPRKAEGFDRAEFHAKQAYNAVVNVTPVFLKDAGKILGGGSFVVAYVVDGAHLLLNSALPDAPARNRGGPRISSLSPRLGVV
jgi:hypothetical protein